MKMKRLVLLGIVAGVSALAVSSCAYDPYYSSSYGGGYGDGYGYGGSGFSTSYFVSTGNTRWGYDPYAGAYYDYTRRCYYDPYLNGYYPSGYRPRYVTGAPHPHGWSRGSNYCAPPSNVRSYNLTNYRDRSERYRSLGQSWSGNVRVTTQGRDQRSDFGSRDQRSPYGGDRNDRSSYGGRTPSSGSIFGSGSQRPSYDGRSSAPTGIFGDRSGGERRDVIPQRNSYPQPDYGSRSGGDRGLERRDNSSIRSAPPTVIPSAPRQQNQNNWGNPAGGRSEAPSFAPQPDRRGNSFGGSRERGDSNRGEGREIRGLGQG